MAAHIAKRPRLHGPNNPALSLASTSSLLESTRQTAASTPKLRHLQAEHENSLRQSALRLKSNWEDICRRYGRDFSGETDEIDLQTGKVVVDNGHLRNLSENIGDTWAFDDFGSTYDEDGDEEEDAGSAATSLEMEIMGMASSDILGSGRLGVAMPRDDEAEEVDVDEMDDLFDELEVRKMTTKPADGKAQQEKQGDALPPRSSSPSGQKDPTGQDSMPSPASSVDGAMPSPRLQPAIKPIEAGNTEAPSLDELPPDDIILEKLGPKWGSALLARVRGLPESSQTVEVEEEQADSSFNAQLTPISDYATPLIEKLVVETEKRADSVEENEDETDAGVLAGADECLDVVSEEEMVTEPVRSDMTPEPEPQVDALAERLESVENIPELAVDNATVEPVIAHHSETELDALAEEASNALSAEQEDGTLDRPFMIEDTPEPEPVPEPITMTLPEQSSPAVETTLDVKVSDPPKEPSAVPEDATMEDQPAHREPEEPDPNYLYGDIDDLSTITLPRSLVPVTPKNRFRIKSKSAMARKVVSAKRGRPPKKQPSDIESPAQHAMSSPLRPRLPSSSSKRLQHTQAEPRQPRNFWSALPDDPFYDPMWQDHHPDGEPSFEDFEQRRLVLEEHSLKRTDSDTVMQDEAVPVVSSPPTAKKTPKPKARATPNKTNTNTPRSQKAKTTDVFESKLHTPRSGRFLEHMRKRVVDKDGVKAEGAPADPASADASTSDATRLEMPSQKIKNEYGLSDSEDELSRELWFVKDKDLEITGSRRRGRKPAKPATREPAPPLVVPDDPPMLSKAGDSMKKEDDDAGEQSSLATCGDPGYRCKKTICFRCIES
ncbi:hypothetical protein TWF696_002021 [Orbilia brochopaga]|uniref:Uncharacterized protein n=1 Tax=Orbilia brochopaga TaxID=3140254 RepID=A0AAV9U739_9PEZI